MEVQQGGAPARAAELEVSLREFTLSDADAEAFMSWASDPRAVRFQRRDAYEHVDQARRYIADHVLPHPWYRAICAREGVGAPLPVVVGSISVKPGPAEDDGRPLRASVGYRVAHAHWGRGVAVAAAPGGRGRRGEPGVAARAGEGRVRQGGRAAQVHPAQGQAQGHGHVQHRRRRYGPSAAAAAAAAAEQAQWAVDAGPRCLAFRCCAYVTYDV